ncbi:DUF2306 domain-containing protein [Streptomyces sp. NPDC004232]|uniref:DUF2306 domain-containing protein n=1 Tax=Streptomyces sp. NPDC004232 TaxID=3154454 RepID=UPI001DD13B1B|nr:DUF2306 domain-containing protein [Streptomyces sp. tea 10]
MFGISRYLTLDPSKSRLGIRTDLPWHYPLFVVHIYTAVVAIVLAWLQVWPSFRARHPRGHRIVGRVYFFAGVFPSAALAIPDSLLTTSGHDVATALLAMDLCWIITGVAGYRTARRRKYGEHRKWMVRNVAMTTSTVTLRPLNVILVAVGLNYEQAYATATWGAVLGHLLFAEWYLLRPKKKRRGAANPR